MQQHLSIPAVPSVENISKEKIPIADSSKVAKVPTVPFMKNAFANLEKIAKAKVEAEKPNKLPEVIDFKKNRMIPPVPGAPYRVRHLNIEKVKSIHLDLPRVISMSEAPPVPIVKTSIDFEAIRRADLKRRNDLIRPIQDFCICRNIPNVPKNLTLMTQKVKINQSLNLISKVEEPNTEGVPPSPKIRIDFNKIEESQKVFLDYFDIKKVISSDNNKVPQIPKIINLYQAAVIP